MPMAGIITLKAQGKDYKAPEKATTIISYEEFTSQLEEAFMSTTIYESSRKAKEAGQKLASK